MIEALESYRQRVGAYPQDSAEVGFPVIDESGPLYYQRNSPTDYIIWYGTTLGESVTYRSTEAKWR